MLASTAVLSEKTTETIFYKKKPLTLLLVTFLKEQLVHPRIPFRHSALLKPRQTKNHQVIFELHAARKISDLLNVTYSQLRSR